MTVLPLSTSVLRLCPTPTPTVGQVDRPALILQLETSLSEEIAQLEREGSEKGSIQSCSDKRYLKLAWREGGKVKNKYLGRPDRLTAEQREMHDRYLRIQALKRAIADLNDWWESHHDAIGGSK